VSLGVLPSVCTVRAMPDVEDQLRMYRNEEKVARDERGADEQDQDARLAATMEKYQSQVDQSGEGSSPPTSDTNATIYDD
jgi:hypothetical protein